MVDSAALLFIAPIKNTSHRGPVELEQPVPQKESQMSLIVLINNHSHTSITTFASGPLRPASRRADRYDELNKRVNQLFVSDQPKMFKECINDDGSWMMCG